MSDSDKPMKISLHDDEYETEEVTRRAAGPPAASLMVAPPTIDGLRSVGPTHSVLPQKAAAVDSSKPGVWALQSVPCLPEFHPLEQTAVFVPHASPSDVSKRISDVLRRRSIEAVYEDEKAKVKCLSPDGVDFRVRLYSGRGNYSHGIIVEVQRRFGTSETFYKDTMAILDAAENKSPSPPTLSFGGSSLPLVSDAEDDDYQVDGASSLAFVAKLLSAGYDSQYLAFQTLIPLTDASKMGVKTSRAVSEALLRSGNEVGPMVLDLILSKKNDQEDVFKLRHMAMTVLANVIIAVKGEIEMSLLEQLRPVLMHELNQADKNPRVAQLSCLCVEQLLKKDHDAAEFHKPLERALQAGTARHAGLERQAQRCLDKLGAY